MATNFGPICWEKARRAENFVSIRFSRAAFYFLTGRHRLIQIPDEKVSSE